MENFDMQGGSRRRRRHRSSHKHKSKKGNGVKRTFRGTRKVLKRARKINKSLLKLISPRARY